MLDGLCIGIRTNILVLDFDSFELGSSHSNYLWLCPAGVPELFQLSHFLLK